MERLDKIGIVLACIWCILVAWVWTEHEERLVKRQDIIISFVNQCDTFFDTSLIVLTRVGTLRIGLDSLSSFIPDGDLVIYGNLHMKGKNIYMKGGNIYMEDSGGVYMEGGNILR